MTLLPDLTPLRESAPYRWLYAGFTLSNVGSQMAVVAIGLQVYALTRSTASVGLVGLAALVPLVVMGLYGGSLADHHDRRLVGLVANAVSWLASCAAAAQAWLGNTHVWVLFVIVAVWSGCVRGDRAGRDSSIYPRILPAEQLPAANALGVVAMNTSLTAGPLHGAASSSAGTGSPRHTSPTPSSRRPPCGPWSGCTRSPRSRTRGAPAGPGCARCSTGSRSCAPPPNVRMTFIADIAAMLLAQPRVLFPAAGAVILGGGASTVGLLYAAAAIGGILAMLVSGPLGSVRRQGLAILVSVAGWGVGIVGFGFALLGADGALTSDQALWAAVGAMAFAGRGGLGVGGVPDDDPPGRDPGPDARPAPGRLHRRRRRGPAAGRDGRWRDRRADRRGHDGGGRGGGVHRRRVLLAVWQRGFVRYDARHPTP